MDDVAVVNLNEERALRADDCKLWSAEECVAALLRDIRSGTLRPEQLIIHMCCPLPNGGLSHHYQCAGVSLPEHIALLALAQKFALDRWLDRD